MGRGKTNAAHRFFTLVDRYAAFVFLFPAVAFVLAMIVFPLAYNLWLSLSSGGFSDKTEQFVGVGNYLRLLGRARFWSSLGRTLAFSGVGLLFQLLLGVCMALLLHRDFPLKRLVRTLLLVPMVTTPVAVAMVWLLIFEPTIGLANIVLDKIGINPLVWLGSPKTALWSLVLVDVWQWTPMVTLVTFASLVGLPIEPYESARIDGASRWQITYKITLPLLVPSLMAVTMLRLIDIIKTFDIIYATTQGGPGEATETVNIYAYLQAFEYFRFNEAAATLMAFLLIILTLSALLAWVRRKLVVAL